MSQKHYYISLIIIFLSVMVYGQENTIYQKSDTTKKKSIINLLPKKVISKEISVEGEVANPPKEITQEKKEIDKKNLPKKDTIQKKEVAVGKVPEELKGRVIDQQTGETLLGANVYVKEQITTGTTTNLDGEFKFKVPKELMNDTLVISYLGYEPQLIPIKKFKNGADVKLKPEGTNLAQVTIKANRLVATEFTKQSIKKIDIYLNPSAKDDPVLAASSLPSSTTVNETAEINFRGSPANETGIFLNDVPVYDAVKFEQDNNIGTFSIFSTEMVDQVLVFPSNPPIEYGNVSSGLLALTTQNEVDFNKVTLNASISQVGALWAQKFSDKFSTTIQGRYQFSDLMKDINPVAYRDIKNFGSGDGSINMFYQPSENTKIKYYAYYDDEDYNIDINDPTLSDVTKYSKTNFFQIGNFTLDTKNGALRINGSQGFNIKSFKFGNLDVKESAYNLYGSSSYTWYFKNNASFKVGVDAERRDFKREGKVPVTGSYEPNAPSEEVNDDLLLDRVEGYTYGKFSLAKWLELGMGLRANLPTDNNDISRISGQSNFKFNLTKNQNIKLGIGQYYKLLTPTTIQFTRQELRSRQVGLDYQWKKDKFLISFGVYYKYNSNYAFNEDYDIYGYELNYQQKIGKNIFSDINFSQVRAEQVNGMKYKTGFDLSYLLKHSLKIDLTHGFNLGTSLIYRQGVPYTPVVGAVQEKEYYLPIYGDTNSMRYPDYFKLDVNLSKIFSFKNGSSLIVYFVANNVTDRKNVDLYYYNREFTNRQNKLYGRRAYYFGIQYQF
ncbi:MAG: carboxypeptidase-like regulatory domain-containing protein [Hyphomicrobiales bacterium]